ncbi:sulfite exporter TauE/SafE family protein [Lampropedia aestuarii]|uniref:Probable membrane transporter protein n=1 Tax=Lampropedia aestuarii TaxID=2562762 RepID=A0A4S5BZX7_9BURK|nr:sulfite exporter TauE/SafE family protein [Lampropedia aestuarii]THJ35678.1 sulfite exporter TauE/SafE family protein [Lampropedia aestuarii]
MYDSFFFWTVLVLVFLLAGLVKGVTGMGLPTVAMGLMGLLMSPAEAVAMLLMPSLVTNVWQCASGGHALPLLRRFWPMLLAIALATTFGMGVLVYADPTKTGFALGVALLLYALYALLAPSVQVPARWERLLSPVIGLLTGLITGATGVFVMPAVPYLQALNLDKDALVQMLGLSFTISTLALGAGLYWQGAWQLGLFGVSSWAIAPALAGMWLGQLLRARISAKRFKQIFLVFLSLLGLQLALGPWL